MGSISAQRRPLLLMLLLPLWSLKVVSVWTFFLGVCEYLLILRRSGICVVENELLLLLRLGAGVTKKYSK